MSGMENTADDAAQLLERIDQQLTHAQALMLTQLGKEDRLRTLDLIAILRLSRHHAVAMLTAEEPNNPPSLP